MNEDAAFKIQFQGYLTAKLQAILQPTGLRWSQDRRLSIRDGSAKLSPLPSSRRSSTARVIRPERKEPYQRRDDHQPRCHPGQDEELGAFVRRDANIVPIPVDDRRPFDTYSRRYRTGDSNGDEGQPIDDDVGQQSQSASQKHSGNSTQQSECNEYNSDAVHDEHRSCRNSESVEPCIDSIGPLQVIEIDVVVAGLVELPLQNFLRVEIEQGGPVGASGDVLANVRFADRVIWHRAWSVESLAVVHDMNRVEVVETEILSKTRDSIFDLGFDGVCDIVNQAEM